MRSLFSRVRRFRIRRRLAGRSATAFPDVGAHRESIAVFLFLERLELNAELKLVRRGQVGKPEPHATPRQDMDHLSVERHRAVMLEVDGQRSSLTNGWRLSAGLQEASAETEIGKLVEA
jgi:hypothetical protein